jgi:hypothetical protein
VRTDIGGTKKKADAGIAAEVSGPPGPVHGPQLVRNDILTPQIRRTPLPRSRQISVQSSSLAPHTRFSGPLSPSDNAQLPLLFPTLCRIVPVLTWQVVQCGPFSCHACVTQITQTLGANCTARTENVTAILELAFSLPDVGQILLQVPHCRTANRSSESYCPPAAGGNLSTVAHVTARSAPSPREVYMKTTREGGVDTRL